MGLFSKLTGSGKPDALDEKEALVAILFETVGADGIPALEELTQLGMTLNKLPVFREFSQVDFERMFTRLGEMHDRIGGPELVARAASVLPKDLHAPAFVNAVDLIFADGEINEDEEAIIADLAEKLGIEHDDGQTIIEVMKLKNFW